jgi:hypothetical protein
MLIGLVLLTIAVAIWLRFLFLVPAVILLWMVPPSVRDAVAGDEPLTWGHAGALAAQLYLAGATRFTYKALRARLLVNPRAEALRQPAAEQQVALEVTVTVEEPAEESAPETPLAPSKPALPCGRVLAPAEAAAFLERLSELRRDLERNNASVRGLLAHSLKLELEYRGQASASRR